MHPQKSESGEKQSNLFQSRLDQILSKRSSCKFNKTEQFQLEK